MYIIRIKQCITFFVIKYTNSFNQLRYVVENKWFAQCLKYLGYEAMPSPSSAADKLDPTQHPGPIDLSPLLDPERPEDRPDQIKKHLVEEMDYSLVPEELWNHLVEDFGLLKGQTPIKRIARQD